MRQFKTFILFLLLANANTASAVITTIAISGHEVAGISGAEFSDFIVGKINASGDAVFTANLSDGAGGISSANDHTLLSFDGTDVAVIAREGSGNVPGVGGANFADFLSFSLDDIGTVSTRARLVDGVGGVTTSNNNGFWQFTGGAGAEIARTTTANAPEVPARFETLATQFVGANESRIAFDGALLTEGGVSSTNNAGLWIYQAASGSLFIRENDAAPGIPTALFGVFTPPAINSNGQLAERATLKFTLGVDPLNRSGIWFYEGSSGQLIARTGVGSVPGLPSASFGALSDPVINDSGQIAFRGQLTTGEEGLWKYTGTSGANVIVTGSANVPEVPDATFASFSTPHLYDSNEVVTLAGLTVGTGGVTTSNSFGLWLFQDDSSDRLLLREGSGGVPDVTGANFDGIEYFAPTAEGVLVQATLEVGTGDVTAANDQGIWLVPFSGNPELLLRKGDQLVGRTIAALTFPTSNGLGSPLRDVSNYTGQFVFRAEFTNGDSGLFLYSLDSSTEFAPADFDTDGDVDDDDLAMWQGAYGAGSVGDADSDGDTDGRDFLIWQRQYTGSAPSLALAVPEPSVSLLFAIGLVISQARILSRRVPSGWASVG